MTVLYVMVVMYWCRDVMVCGGAIFGGVVVCHGVVCAGGILAWWM